MSDAIEPTWLSVTQVRMLHSEALQLFGGSAGIRDEALLESAVDRAKNKWHYDPTISVGELAAAYAFGIAKNHAFVDGNKRAALLAIRAFLFMNVYKFEPGELEAVSVIEGLAAGKVDERTLSGWIEDNTSKRA